MIYVDTAMIAAKVPNRRVVHDSLWCHLLSDQPDPEELHRFAARLGLRRSYFQHKPGNPAHDHYDLTLGKRAQAIALGATVLDQPGMAALLTRRRALFPRKAGVHR